MQVGRDTVHHHSSTFQHFQQWNYPISQSFYPSSLAQPWRHRKSVFASTSTSAPPCATVSAPINSCVNVPDGYNDNISSLEPNIDAGNCRFYVHYNCDGPSFDSEYPGYDKLTTQLPEFNDAISSFKCFGRLPNDP
ncbi:hypothetical protein TrVGV298_008979 [Trichoderma virens]|nr:hypothetical protein TrVGV298_008979 [Trichoderma virens]